jgi:hypothetical protein
VAAQRQRRFAQRDYAERFAAMLAQRRMAA